MIAIVSFAALIGLLVGSFLNVVAARMPEGISLVRPGSRCPHCGIEVRPQDNVPVLSWLWLRGECRGCHQSISARYPLVEAGTAVLLAAVAAVHHDATPELVLGAVLVLFLVPITLIDADHRIIPNKLTGPAAIVAIALGTALDPGGEVERLLAGAAAGGGLLLVALIKPNGMGMGDFKLAGVMGLFLGAPVAIALFVGFLAGSIVGGVIMARKGIAEGRKTTVPFGPFLAFGGVVAILCGAPLIDAYLGTFG